MAEAAVARRPGAGALLAGQLGYAGREYLRNPVAALVTVALPLIFLVVTGLVAGAQPDAPAGQAAIQTLAPAAAVFAAVMAAFVMLPFAVAVAREQGILKRLQGTPLPLWAYLFGRVGVALAVAFLGTALMLAVAVAVYDLEVVGRALPAAAVALVVGTASFTALGFAVLAAVRASQAALSLTMGAVVLVGFVSDLFALGAALPRWLDVVGWVLPLRHFVEALTSAFDPGAAAAGFAPASLAALAAWGLAGTLAALRWFDAEPRGGRARAVRARGSARSRAAGRPAGGTSHLRLVWAQTRHANRSVWREPMSAFFALAFPALFVAFLPLATGNPVIEGTPFAELMTTAMPVFGLGLTAYVTLPEAVASARDRGVLKRLRGTPLPAWAYLAGRVASVVWIGAITVVIVFGVGWALHGVAAAPRAVPALAVTLLAGVACLAALGLAVAALVPDAKTVPAVTLATFMPLVFLSDVFPIGELLPAFAQTVGWVFPLKHLVHALREAFTAGVLSGAHLAVVGAWTVAGLAVALARFRWSPKTS